MPALLAMLAIMTLALMLAMPSWRYLAQDDKEQELLFRGKQISDAIARFQRKNGNAFPASLEQLVQGKFLRKAYADPLSNDGKWRVIRPGEAGPMGPGNPPPAARAGRPGPGPRTTPTPAFGSPTSSGGPVAGVASRSPEQGFRTVNGTQFYSRWVFSPAVPLVIGGQAMAGRVQGPAPGGPNPAPPQGSVRAPDLEATRLSR